MSDDDDEIDVKVGSSCNACPSSNNPMFVVSSLSLMDEEDGETGMVVLRHEQPKLTPCNNVGVPHGLHIDLVDAPVIAVVVPSGHVVHTSEFLSSE